MDHPGKSQELAGGPARPAGVLIACLHSHYFAPEFSCEVFHGKFQNLALYSFVNRLNLVPELHAQVWVADVAAIVTAAAKQLRDKSLKTKAGVFTVLKELVVVLTNIPWLTPTLVEQLIPGICSALKVHSLHTRLS